MLFPHYETGSVFDGFNQINSGPKVPAISV